MATVHDYTFYQTSRIGDDQCDLSQRNIQNGNSCNYMLDNFFPDCPMTKPAIIRICTGSLVASSSQWRNKLITVFDAVRTARVVKPRPRLVAKLWLTASNGQSPSSCTSAGFLSHKPSRARVFIMVSSPPRPLIPRLGR